MSLFQKFSGHLLFAFLCLLSFPGDASAQGAFDYLTEAQAPAAQATAPVGGDVNLTPQQPSPIDPGMKLARASEQQRKPFGWELFAANRVAARSVGINPQYAIAPGDKIQVEIWGAQQESAVLTVDLQGNIFLPGVGPVRVAGRSEAALNSVVSRAISNVYTDEVRVYTNLLNTQPVGIYVTGAVSRPGRFAGERTDSVIYYLQQAGGIDLERGSFRDIRVLRGDTVLASIDLYDFLLAGRIPALQFQDNDTIVVGPQRASVLVTGEVRNSYLFELDAPEVRGSEIIKMAAPLPKASHVAVKGVRQGQPFNVYASVETLSQLNIQNGDELAFQADLASETIFVSVVGQSEGPASFSVRRGTTLEQILDIIPVEPQVADLSSIYLRRKSVAERQKEALSRALDELQRSILTTPSSSSTSAQIRAQEAALIQKFVNDARSVEPEGRVVLTSGVSDRELLMEEGDVVVVPQKSNLVIISGEVRLPQTVLYTPDKEADDYIDDAGGYTERANDDLLLVVRQSGAVVAGSNPQIQPGDHVTVLPDAADRGMAIFKDVIDIVYKIAVSSGVIVRLAIDND